MLIYRFSFEKVYSLIPKWSWNELFFGLERDLITAEDIISFVAETISLETEQLDTVIEMYYADKEDIKEIIAELIKTEPPVDQNKIKEKWIFSIILYGYYFNKDRILDIIEDVYSEFDYPKYLASMVRYMPYDGDGSLSEKLERYIGEGKEIWCK